MKTKTTLLYGLAICVQKQTVAGVCQIALNIADLIQCCLIWSVYDTCMSVCLYLLYILRTLALWSVCLCV